MHPPHGMIRLQSTNEGAVLGCILPSNVTFPELIYDESPTNYLNRAAQQALRGLVHYVVDTAVPVNSLPRIEVDGQDVIGQDVPTGTLLDVYVSARAAVPGPVEPRPAPRVVEPVREGKSRHRSAGACPRDA